MAKINQFIEIFYFIAVPISALAALCSIVFKEKIYLLISSVALLGSWLLTIQNRERRYDLLTEHSFKKVDELHALLGSPDHILNDKEGDALWMYSVRSMPWNTVQWFAVYNNYILAKSGGRSVGLFYREKTN